jgi:hypothetical protein
MDIAAETIKYFTTPMMIKSKMLIDHVHLSDIKIIYKILKYNYEGRFACSLNLHAIKNKQKTFYFILRIK